MIVLLLQHRSIHEERLVRCQGPGNVHTEKHWQDSSHKNARKKYAHSANNNLKIKYNMRYSKSWLFVVFLAELASDGLKGRVFEVSLADLQNDEQAFRKFRLISEDIQGKVVLTNFHGMTMTTDKLRSLVKKWQVSCVGSFLKYLYFIVHTYPHTRNYDLTSAHVLAHILHIVLY